MNFSKFEIKTEGAITRIYKDNEELKGVRKAIVAIEAGCITTIDLEFVTTELTATVDAVFAGELKNE